MKNDIYIKLYEKLKNIEYMETELDIPGIKKINVFLSTLYDIIVKLPDLSITAMIINEFPKLQTQFKNIKNSTFLAITDESWLSLYTLEEIQLNIKNNKFNDTIIYGLIINNYKHTEYIHNSNVKNVNNNLLFVERDKDQIYIENIRVKLNNSSYTTMNNCILYMI
jgi:hypothetical protein